ncbi:hypothetical protein SCA6_014932 [Theobroma cacao]
MKRHVVPSVRWRRLFRRLEVESGGFYLRKNGKKKGTWHRSTESDCSVQVVVESRGMYNSPKANTKETKKKQKENCDCERERRKEGNNLPWALKG